MNFRYMTALGMMAALLAASCTRDEITDGKDGVQDLFLTASSPDDVSVNPFGTKTSMVPNGDCYSVYWSEDDVISVNGVESSAIAVEEGNEKKAVFEVKGVAVPCSAVYPASAVSAFSDGQAELNLPSSQTYVPGSFDPASALMLGYSSDGSALNFSHVMAYLYITVDTVDGYDEEFSQYYGRTYADSPDIDGRVWIACDEDLSEGEFVTVCVDGLIEGDLSGYIVEEEK